MKWNISRVEDTSNTCLYTYITEIIKQLLVIYHYAPLPFSAGSPFFVAAFPMLFVECRPAHSWDEHTKWMSRTRR
jgi:hypothetical protein